MTYLHEVSIHIEGENKYLSENSCNSKDISNYNEKPLSVKDLKKIVNQIINPSLNSINLIGYWSENQNITAGERLATVVSQDSAMIVGRMFISSVSLGKVKAGQKVNVKLNGFPYMEYGILRGQLTSISAIPENSTVPGGTGINNYAAEVHFPEGMISSYKTRFDFIQQMDGTGEIITQDLRLIERFFQPIKNIIKNN